AMDYKLLILIVFLFTLFIKIQTGEPGDNQSDANMDNIIEFMLREARSFGCNGYNKIHIYKCKMNCQRRHSSGIRCIKSSHGILCVCATKSS
ncbi:unnamed protein product, partial [Rotaria sp. Silwood2]